MRVMNTDSSLAALDQYRTNVQPASNRHQHRGQLASTDRRSPDAREGARRLAGRRHRGREHTRQPRMPRCSSSSRSSSRSATRSSATSIIFGGAQSQTVPFTQSGSGATLSYASTNPTGTRQVDDRRRPDHRGVPRRQPAARQLRRLGRGEGSCPPRSIRRRRPMDRPESRLR